MDEISTFKFNSVNLRNLKELSERESRLKEQRICELSELSECLGVKITPTAEDGCEFLRAILGTEKGDYYV